MSHRSLKGSRAIVTGASGGIGRAIAVELAKHGAEVLAIARREEKLRDLATEIATFGQELQFIVGDISEPATRSALLDMAKKRWGALDILVNNAGVGAFGPFADASEDRLRRVFEVNFFALTEMTRAAVSLLKRGNRPIVVNIGSVLGYRAMPGSSEYCASKFAVRGLTESLRVEFARIGIDVLLVSPSTTETEFFDRPLEKHGSLPWSNRPRTPASEVAARVVAGIRHGRREIVISIGGKLFVWFSRTFPRLMDRLLKRIG